MSEAVRLLCVGDIHLGRRPSRLPDDLDEHGVAAGDLTPAAGWRATWEHAIRSRVHGVLLAGDVVESANARFEAFGHLRRGVERLAEAGIPTYAVAGNHDVEALPRLARLIPYFHLVGAGGRWESVVVPCDGVPAVRVLGWSFGATRETGSPLDTLPPAPGDGLPIIGLLHCDLDARPGTPYAPVWRSELAAAYPDAWLLGHIHRPSLAAGPRPIGYLGSLVGLDPSESGVHGPWLLTIAADARVRLEQLPLAPLRWEDVEVDAALLGDDEDLLVAALTAAIGARHDAIAAELGEVKAIGCRVRVRGATPLHRRLRRALATPEHERVRWHCGEVLYFVHEIRDESSPPYDLERMARGADPKALLARQLLALEGGGAAADELIEAAARRLRDVAAQPVWGPLEPDPLGREEVRAHLRCAAEVALEELRGQAEEGEGARA